jgi:hypothetical protein
VPRVLGTEIDPQTHVAQLREELRQERRAAERLLSRQAEHVRYKSTHPPALAPPAVAPEPAIVAQGPGWRASIPLAVLVAVVTAITARCAPTPTQDSASLGRVETTLQVRELRDEQFRGDVRATLQRIEDRQDKAETRISVIERPPGPR